MICKKKGNRNEKEIDIGGGDDVGRAARGRKRQRLRELHAVAERLQIEPVKRPRGLFVTHTDRGQYVLDVCNGYYDTLTEEIPQ